MSKEIDISQAEFDKFIDLMGKARKGDAAACRDVFDMFPTVPELVECMEPTIAATAETLLLQKIYDEKDLFAKEACRRHLRALRERLLKAGASPLEELLADRIALCWLELHYFEAHYANGLGRVSVQDGAYGQERIDHAHKRYLGAVRALAQVRRLLGPTLQVTIADKQLIVGGATQPVQAAPTATALAG